MSRVAIPITMASQLPVVGTSYETSALDFKRDANLKDPLELAKDIAAFANQLGGTILVGMQESNEGLAVKWFPMTASVAAEVQTAYERAALEHLSPRPRVQAARIPIKGGECIAVNIEPYVDGVVAARADAKNPHVWRFPIRIGKECKWLTPEEVALMTPETRKAIVMLSRINYGARIVKLREVSTKGASMDSSELRFGEVRDGDNALRLLLSDDRVTSYPLDMVRSVYRDEHGWHIVMHAFR